MQKSLKTLRICYAIGQSVFNSKIKNKKLNLSDFIEKFTHPQIRDQKDGPYIVLAEFNSNRRNAASLVKHYGAIIDLDNTPLTHRQIRVKLKGILYVLYSTYSHKLRGKGDRYRIIIPYAIPVEHQQHVLAIITLMSKLGLDNNVDLSSKSLSQPMYLPAVSEKRKEHFVYDAQTDKDRLLYDASQKITLDPVLQWEQDELGLASKEFLEAQRLNANDNKLEGSRNNALTQYVGRAIRMGHDFETVLEQAQIYNSTKLTPPLKSKEVNGVVANVFGSHKTNHNDQDWGHAQLDAKLNQFKKINLDEFKLLAYSISGSRKNISPPEWDLLVRKLSDKSDISIKAVKSELKNCTEEIAQEKINNSADPEGEAEEQDNNSGLSKSAYQRLRARYSKHFFRDRENDMWNSVACRSIARSAFDIVYPLHPKMSKTAEYLVKNRVIPSVCSNVYYPKSDKLLINIQGDDFVNSHKACPIRPSPRCGPRHVAPLLDHFKLLFPNKYERNIILDYFAFILQRPGHKTAWMPIDRKSVV